MNIVLTVLYNIEPITVSINFQNLLVLTLSFSVSSLLHWAGGSRSANMHKLRVRLV